MTRVARAGLIRGTHASTHTDAEVDLRTAALRPAGYRYGAVFLLTVALVVFIIVAPAADWSRAVGVAIEGAALVVAFGTSRAREEVRRARATAAGVAAALIVVGVATEVLPGAADFALAGLLAAAIPLSLAGGLARLVAGQGVTLQAVAGALAIYLLIGLMFAWSIGFVARVDSAPYFSQGTDGTASDWVYYSFVVLTTTGFGDLTAARPVGHALAVIEMLVGQLYLVTVIGVLVGNFVRRR
ncbi:MAG TPA: ion channel [Baekduia sp.]|uniref:ion channel n=1 Tax=Baekduia sp. TaxID=2600305 RepID=UPI002C20470C|nr:ion channel [Baekduia sp.]HMJ33391.1 ion channel [Baekduia sp.]